MIIGVGAVTQRVVKVAAQAQVPQIVASRRQVNSQGGYIGWTSKQLVHIVRELSKGHTRVVRDHGGPHQGGDEDEGAWNIELDHDMDAGFDSLHLDVSKLSRDRQPSELEHLVKRYGAKTAFEIGGERDEQGWLDELIKIVITTGLRPEYAVVDLGGHIWNDRQCGSFISEADGYALTDRYNAFGIKTKAHNMDWAGNRRRFEPYVDAMNIAPEYAGVEADAWLHVMSMADGDLVLERAYESKAWERWFHDDEGTWHDRARCALRYCMMDEDVRDTIARYRPAEHYVRGRIQDALHSV